MPSSTQCKHLTGVQQLQDQHRLIFLLDLGRLRDFKNCEISNVAAPRCFEIEWGVGDEESPECSGVVGENG